MKDEFQDDAAASAQAEQVQRMAVELHIVLIVTFAVYLLLTLPV